MGKSKGQTLPPADTAGAWVQLATRVPRELHRAVKVHCVTSGQSVMDFVVDALRDRYERETRTGRRASK